jgi:hypothetical protein
MLIKEDGTDDNGAASATARRYSPNKVTGEEVRVMRREPVPALISATWSGRTSPCG